MKHCLLQRAKKKAKFTKLVTASDDWYPSINGNKVSLTWHPKQGRISVWGDDDFGMDKQDASEAEFHELGSLVLSQSMLKKRGFIPC